MEDLNTLIDGKKIAIEANYIQISNHNVKAQCLNLSNALLIAYHFRAKDVTILKNDNGTYNVSINDTFGRLKYLVDTSKSN